MDEHLIINLRIADMRYPLQVKRADEEMYRRAAIEIDYKISQYRKRFTGGLTQSLRETDYMAMTAIQAVAGKVDHEIRAEEFERKIKELTLELDKYLKGG